MRAAVYERYGSPDVISIREIPAPEPSGDELLVRVRASSVNAMDWYFLTGTPYPGRLMTGFPRPKHPVLGVDFAGVVERAGARVRGFRPGDAVFGAARGAFAELVRVAESRVAPIPEGVSFEHAASLPIAGLTALQGLRDEARLAPGQQVLVHGASGGVGTFAIQVAKALGARVTAVCGPHATATARACGADDVVDRTREDFTRRAERFDALFDVAGTRSIGDCRRVLKPGAPLVIVGGPRSNRWVGPLPHIVAASLARGIGDRRIFVCVARVRAPDLAALAALVAGGRVHPAVDGVFPLAEAAAAFRHFGEGHPRGKVILVM